MITTLHNFIAVMQCYTMLHISYIIFSLQLCSTTRCYRYTSSQSAHTYKNRKSQQKGKPAKQQLPKQSCGKAWKAWKGKPGKPGKPNHSRKIQHLISIELTTSCVLLPRSHCCCYFSYNQH